MSDQAKDTIYIDVDDEITTIIDKLRGSEKKVVALVLPKRATTLQSVVNMKLLKRTADEAKKNVVLITSESGLLPLAGSVGLYVAKTLQSKPELPDGPDKFEGADAIDDTLDVESEPTDFDPKEAASKPVGDLADQPKAKSPTAIDETIDLSSMALGGPEDMEPEAPKRGKKGDKKKKNKALKVPDFNNFRKWLLIGGVGLIALIVLLVWLIKFLPTAKITVQTSNSTVPANLNVALDTAAKSLDSSSNTVAAISQSVQKTNSQQESSTGQQNNGTDASGPVVFSAPCIGGSGTQIVIPANRAVIGGGLTFTTQEDTVLTKKGGTCTGSGNVTAQQPGTQSNVASGTTFSVPGQDYNGVSGQNFSAFTGGTDNIVKIVAQADVDSAVKQLATQDTSSIKQQLVNALNQQGLYPVVASFNAGNPTNTPNPAVGTQASTVTVTQTISYTMLGVKKSDLSTLVDNAVKKQISDKTQSIASDGLDSATITQLSQSGTKTMVSIATKATIGTLFDQNSIKNQIVGKKSGDIQSIIKGYPGVTNVTVHFSPFWVNSAPSNTSKIKLDILNAS